MERRSERRASQFQSLRRSSRHPIREPVKQEEKPDKDHWDMDRDVEFSSLLEFMKEHWIIITIILIGISLRIMLLNHESFWIDEAMTGLRSRWDFEYMIDEVAGQDQMPLYFTITWLLAQTFGNSVIVLRGLSVIFGVTAFLPIYKIGKRFGRETAIIGLALFAFSPTMIYYSQEARMYMLMVLLSAISFYFYLEFMEPRKWIKRTAGVILVLANVSLIYIHYFGAVFVALEMIAMISTLVFRSFKENEGFRPKEWISGSLPVIISLMTFVPWLIFQQVTHTISEKSTGGSLGLRFGLIPETFRFMGGQYTAVFKNDTNIALITGIVFTIVLAISTIFILTEKKRDSEKNSVLIFGSVLLFISPVLIFVISRNFTPMYNHRYLIFMIIPFFLFISMAITSLKDRLKEIGFPGHLVVLIVLGILLVPSIMTDIDQLSRRDKADWKGGIDLIMENREERDVVVPFPGYEQMLIYYYTDDLDIELIGSIEDSNAFLMGHDRVWLIFYKTEPIDDQPMVMELNKWAMEEYPLGEINVRLYMKG